MVPWVTKKRYAAFISHHQRDSAMEARYLKEQLETLLGEGAEIRTPMALTVIAGLLSATLSHSERVDRPGEEVELFAYDQLCIK